jgi:hypothetical protein
MAGLSSWIGGQKKRRASCSRGAWSVIVFNNSVLT